MPMASATRTITATRNDASSGRATAHRHSRRTRPIRGARSSFGASFPTREPSSVETGGTRKGYRTTSRRLKERARPTRPPYHRQVFADERRHLRPFLPRLGVLGAVAAVSAILEALTLTAVVP